MLPACDERHIPVLAAHPEPELILRKGSKAASKAAQVMPQIKGSKPIDAWEALQCIQSTQTAYAKRASAQPNNPDPTPPNLAYILAQASAYLSSPDSSVRAAATTDFALSTPLTLVQCVQAKFGANALFETEYLQLLDLRPKNAIELETVVEDFEARFGERQEELLEIVRDVLGEVPRVTVEERQEEEEERRKAAELLEEEDGRGKKGKGRA